MIGVFDSGAGGAYCARLLAGLLPQADIVFYADRENAPYGTKSEAELRSLLLSDVEKLRSFGAERIFAACGTAGSVMLNSPEEPTFDGIANVLVPTAKAATEATQNGYIGVIATARTASSGIYGKLIRALCPACQVMEIPAQPLVSLAETPPCLRNPDDVRTAAEKIRAEFGEFEPDTLILGCTHFSCLKRALADTFSVRRMIGCAEEGTRAFAASLGEREKHGSGRLIFL